jgi:chromate reductase
MSDADVLCKNHAPLFKHLETGDLPLYNQDDDANPHPSEQRFKREIAAAHAILFVTPEYNRSVPDVLKNAIEYASPPYGIARRPPPG